MIPIFLEHKVRINAEKLVPRVISQLEQDKAYRLPEVSARTIKEKQRLNALQARTIVELISKEYQGVDASFRQGDWYISQQSSVNLNSFDGIDES